MIKRPAIKSLLVLGTVLIGATAQAQPPHSLKMAIGEPGSATFAFGTELWAMGQINLQNQHGISLATVEVLSDEERLSRLQEAEIEMALIRGDVSRTSSAEVRTVMAVWPEGKGADTGTPTQIVARADVDEEIIYRLTKSIFENAGFFKASQQKLGGEASLSAATRGGAWPLHTGARRYYEERGVEMAGALSKPIPIVEVAGSKIVPAPRGGGSGRFVNFDDRTLNAAERAQVAAACRQALELGALSNVLGDLSSTGCEAYQSHLDDRSDVRTATTMFGNQGGQGGPAISLEAATSERARKAPARSKGTRQPTM